jgi:membrane protease YdiL (CAAX protease family)
MILNGQTNIYISVGAAIFESVTIFFGVYLFGIKRKNYPWTTVGLQKISNKWITLSVIVGIIAIPLSSLIANLLQNTLNLSTENPQLPFLVPDNLSVMGMIIMAILVGLIIPFVEELFFRGIIYSWLRNRFNIGVGILISSAIFGLVHVDLAVAGTAFVLGIILGLVFEYSKSLWASVIIHSINNGIQILILYAFIILGENPI